MSNKSILIKIYILAAAFILICPALAQTPEALLKWKPVPGAIAYEVEIKDAKNETVIFKKTNTSSISVGSIPPGEYKFRVAAIANGGKRGLPSAWSKVKIAKALIPSVSGVSRDTVYSNVIKNKPVVISGDNFTENTVFYVNDGKTKKRVESRYLSSEKAELVIPPAEAESGKIEITAVNGGMFSSADKVTLEVRKSTAPVFRGTSTSVVTAGGSSRTISVSGENMDSKSKLVLMPQSGSESGSVGVYPEKSSANSAEYRLPDDIKPGRYKIMAEGDDGEMNDSGLSITVKDKSGNLPGIKDSSAAEDKKREGMSISLTVYPALNIILGPWSDYLKHSYTSFGAAVTVSSPFTRSKFLSGFSFGVESDYIKLKGKDVFNVVKSDMKIMSAGAYVGYSILYVKMFQNSEFTVMPGISSGVAKTTLKTESVNGSETINSYDIYAAASIRAGFVFNGRVIVEAVPEFRNYFFKEQALRDARFSLRAGLLF